MYWLSHLLLQFHKIMDQNYWFPSNIKALVVKRCWWLFHLLSLVSWIMTFFLLSPLFKDYFFFSFFLLHWKLHFSRMNRMREVINALLFKTPTVYWLKSIICINACNITYDVEQFNLIFTLTKFWINDLLARLSCFVPIVWLHRGKPGNNS